MMSDSSVQGGLERLRLWAEGRASPSPLDTMFGIAPAQVNAGEVTLRATPRAEASNIYGVAHGGWIATLIDAATGAAVESTLAPGERYLTLNLNISYLRAVQSGAEAVVAHGRIVRRGARIATSEARLEDSRSELCALGVATCLIVPSA
jgi:uncharacterized protein (TIGR00369 family)